MPAIYGSVAQPPQQHLNTVHFAMATLLLLLTVYPYLFNQNQVAALSADDIDHLTHQSIETFGIIQADDLVWSRPTKTRRDTRGQLLHASSLSSDFQNELSNAKHQKEKLQKPIRQVQFSSLGRKFNLLLDKISNKDNSLISKNFTVVALDSEGRETLVPFDSSDIQILEGYVDGETESRVVASFSRSDKLMTAQIKTGNDIIIVEPTYLHKQQLLMSSVGTATTTTTTTQSTLPYLTDVNSNTSQILSDKLYNGSMIVYNLRDHRHFQETKDIGKLCAPVKVDMNFQEAATNQPIRDGRTAETGFQEIPPDEKVGSVFTSYYHDEQNQLDNNETIGSVVDQETVNPRSKRSIENNKPRDRTRCTLQLVADYLFYKNVGNGDVQTTINYLLALVNRVNKIYLPTVWETGEGDSFKNIGFTVQNITIHQEFTRASINSDIHYNMAGDRQWGAREFLDNFSKNSPPRHYCLAHLFTYRQFDTPVLGLAYVASPRLGAIGGICSQVQQKGDSLYKHNTGISTSKGISGETLITRQTDLVVAHEFGHNFGAEHDSNECRPAPSKGGAFLMHPFAVMGFEKNNRFLSNCSRLSIGRVLSRKASSCFVQVADHVCGNGIVEDDEQCDGGDLGYGHRDPCCDSNCHFTPGSQCSDRHSWCCNKCRIRYAGFPCRPAEELNCKQSSYCDGSSAECLPPPPIEDNTTCIGGGFCRSGDCIPFCEAHDLLSCMCNTPANACKLCCKATLNGTCTPYDTKAPYLPDGNQCYRGVCEKGRCEQPIQDVVERLWDVIEDITLTTFVKFLRDNIILVVLVCSIPIWCLFSYYINEFDKRFKHNLMNAMMRQKRRKNLAHHSPFLPSIFVSDEPSDLFYDGNRDLSKADQDPMASQPLRPKSRDSKPPFNTGQYGDSKGGYSRNNNGGHTRPPPHQPGFIHRVPDYGFRLPEGEEVVFGPQSTSLALNSIELPQMAAMDDSNSSRNVNTSNEEDQITDGQVDHRNGDSYSTQV